MRIEMMVVVVEWNEQRKYVPVLAPIQGEGERARGEERRIARRGGGGLKRVPLPQEIREKKIFSLAYLERGRGHVDM